MDVAILAELLCETGAVPQSIREDARQTQLVGLVRARISTRV